MHCAAAPLQPTINRENHLGCLITCQNQPRQLRVPAQRPDLCLVSCQQRHAVARASVPHSCSGIITTTQQQVRQQWRPYCRERALGMAHQGVQQAVITLYVQVPPAWEGMHRIK